MADFATIALGFCVVATSAHLLSIALAMTRVLRPRRRHVKIEPVSIIRPICGVDDYDEATLRSTFELDARDFEILFCAAREDDAAVPVVRRLIAEYPSVQARLLVGDDRPTPNPKLNNIVKGWKSARKDWIVLADNNVLMPRHYLNEMFANFSSKTGLVCSPPVGSRPDGLWAELECAFLNTYQARWQLAADTIRFGFAQGKSMLWRRELLEDAGGIQALGAEIAEDAAATKIVRSRGLGVRLVDRPFEQPLGSRTSRQVWDRQVRWARLRRATFRLYYAPEVLTGSALPITAGLWAAPAFGINPLALLIALLLIWYGAEAVLAKVARWHLGELSPLAWVLRDLLLPLLWLQGWAGDTFVWRGNDMSVAKIALQAGDADIATAATS